MQAYGKKILAVVQLSYDFFSTVLLSIKTKQKVSFQISLVGGQLFITFTHSFAFVPVSFSPLFLLLLGGTFFVIVCGNVLL